jgi:hypothetical protein
LTARYATTLQPLLLPGAAAASFAAGAFTFFAIAQGNTIEQEENKLTLLN